MRKISTFIIGAVVLASCAAAQKSAMIAEDALARVTTAGYMALDQYDEAQINKIKTQAETDLDGAMKSMAQYAPKRDKAIKALDAASSLIQAADLAREGTGAAKADPKGFLEYAALFAKAAAQVTAALGDLGVKLPSGVVSALGALGVQ